MDVRSLGFRTDLALLESAGSQIEDRGELVVVRTPDNPQFYWGNFFLLAAPPAPDAVAGLIEDYDRTFPDSRHRAMGVDGTEDQSRTLGPLLDAGFTLDPGTVMTASSTHEPPRPNRDATYRRLVSDDDWEQRVELAAACNDDHEPETYRLFAERKAASERGRVEAGHGAWWGAFLDGRLLSTMGLFTASPGLARFQSVETHPEARGRGLAGTLVHAVSSYGFDELGADTLVMVADPDYLAIRVYRSVGFTDAEHQTQIEQRQRT
ncbi:putative GCN5-related N-acetyltransferase [metagenome]|uniref:Putative GCN5-related N-acetyltransferase n=1 Tax=metagenome TaxID=256318 RepID=A0A2P2CE07_9ZZZZ